LKFTEQSKAIEKEDFLIVLYIPKTNHRIKKRRNKIIEKSPKKKEKEKEKEKETTQLHLRRPRRVKSVKVYEKT